MAGDADSGDVHIGEGSHELHGVIHTIGVVFGQQPSPVGNRVRVAVAVHINGHHHEAPAGVLHIVEILHLTVVIPAVAAHDGRGRIVHSRGIRDEQQGAHLVAGFRFPAQVFDRNVPEVGLHQAGTNAADQQDDQCNAKDAR